MPFTRTWTESPPARAEVEGWTGAGVLEFGTSWCGHCIAAQPLIEQALQAHPQLHHLKIEDGRGKPLGRSYRVKLWPTLVFLRQGQEVARVVRPSAVQELERVLALLD